MIILDDVYYQYEPAGIEALRGVSLQIHEGEHLALIGPNGCGKTTLIRHLNALLLPQKGKVWVDHLDTADKNQWTTIRLLVGMVFQNPDHQIVGMTVEEDVAFGPENLCLPASEIRTRVAEALDKVGIPDLAGRHTENLSGGEKRLVAIAGVLAMRPRYIMLDEPTAFLDPSAAGRILDVMDRLHAEGMGILHITHNMAEAALTQRIVVMNRGKIHLQGKPREIFARILQLREIGLSLPQITDLFLRLQSAGVPVTPDVVTVEEAFYQIRALLQEDKT